MTTPADTERRRRERAGRAAERAATWLLRLKGYRILARRFRTPVGEIDIVARRGHTVVFVEVKARTTETEALESVTPRQRQRIGRAAEAFLQKSRAHRDCDIRFDLIAVTPRILPRHYMDAWRES